MIRSENGYLDDLVSIDVRGRDVGGYVADAKVVVAREVNVPPGYRLEWSGQYEALQRVKARLVQRGLLTQQQADQLRARFTQELQEAHRKVRDEPQPDPRTILDQVFADKDLVRGEG